MIKFIKSFFSKKEEAVAPYKVEEPTQTYESLKPAKVEVAEQATQAVVESIAPAKKPAKAKKAPAAKKTRAPRKPKAV